MDVRNRFRWFVGLTLLACAAMLVWLAPSNDDASAPAERMTRNVEPKPVPAVTQTAEVQTTAPPVTPETAAPSGVLRGKVIDAVTRKPVREFKVELLQARGTIWRRDTPAARDFRTADGTFIWEKAPAGIWRIIIAASGYQRFEIHPARIETSAATTEFVVPLRKGRVVRGRVFDELSGEGIAEAIVTFREADVEAFGEFRSLPQTKTSKEGAFSLDGVPPGRVAIGVHARDYVQRDIVIAVDGTTLNLDVAMFTGASIRGRLTTPDGAAISGHVGLMDLDHQSASSRRPDAQGEFSFELLDAGHYRLSARAEAMLAEQDIVLVHNQRLDVTLVMQSGRTVRGIVTGLPLEELNQTRVALSYMHAAADVLDAPLDAQGRFELRGAKAGQALLVATTPHRRFQKRIEVPTDADANVELRATAGFRLHGRVTRAGKPVPNVDVTLLSNKEPNMIHGFKTSAEGRYSIDGVPRGEWIIAAGYFKRGPILIAQNMEYDIDIPIGELKGEIVDTHSRAPIVGAHVSLWSPRSSMHRTRRFNRSDHFGRFAVDAVDPGSYVLTIARSGFALYREQIELPAQSTVSVRLSADEGIPIRAQDAATGAPLAELVLDEKNEQRGAGIFMDIALDDQGAGHVPSGFAGGTLEFIAPGYLPHEARGWNGQALTLRFRRETTDSYRE